MRSMIWKCLLFSAATIFAGPAFAQMQPGRPDNPQEVIPEKDRSLPNTKAYEGGPQPQNPLREGRSGSAGMNRDASGGVIKPPPGVDPGISKSAPVPYPNSTPVIPPPAMSEEGEPIIPK